MNKTKAYLLATVTVVVLVAVFFAYRSTVYHTEISNFRLSASVMDSAGISSRSHFILETSSPLSPQVLEKYIKTSPDIGFSIKKVQVASLSSGNTDPTATTSNIFEIIPDQELPADQILTIQVPKGPIADREYSWAYQVKAPFQIVASTPKDKGIDVPTNSGIEIQFNRDIDTSGAKYLELIPAIPGRTEISGNKITFIPTNPLQDRSIYSVKIHAGLKAMNSSDVLPTDQTLQFQTTSASYDQNRSGVSFERQFSEFRPNADIRLGVYAWRTDRVTATVYRFDSAQELVASVNKVQSESPWAKYLSNIDPGVDKAQKIFNSDLNIEKRGESTYDASGIVSLPQQLAVGYYAIVIQNGKSRDISWFQVNPVASFTAFSSVNSLVWLKDINSGKNSAGVALYFDGKPVATTGVDGVGTFDTPAELVSTSTTYYYSSPRGRQFLIAKLSTGDLAIPIENQYGYSGLIQSRDKWWDYVSLNKEIYLPTDVIKFWGLVKPRQGSSPTDEITVKLSNSYWMYDASREVKYAETKIKLSDYSTVSGELSYTGLKPGTYSLTFLDGDEVITNKTVTVSAYIKPAYKITVSPDKNVIFAGESSVFKVKTQFFDGTPLSNVDLSYSYYGYMGNGSDSRGTLTLNAQGEGYITLPTTYKNEDNDWASYWPKYLYLNVQPARSEEGNITGSAQVTVFGPKIYNTISESKQGDIVSFDIKTQDVVIKDPYSAENFFDHSQFLGGARSGVSTKVDILEMVYTKTQTDTGYDWINKLTYPIYTYETKERPISTVTIISDQNGIARMSYTVDKTKMYKFVFTSFDAQGRTVKDNRYVYGNFSEDTTNIIDYYYHLDPQASKSNYHIGDAIDLKLRINSRTDPPAIPGGYLFMTVNNGSIGYQMSDTPEFVSTFSAQNIPNISVTPAWFAANRFHTTYGSQVSFDAGDRRLKIDVTKDKTTYKPGENVSLNIKVTDKDGKPVRAEVNLSALDEAVFSIRPSESDPVENIYANIYSELNTRTSNMPAAGRGGAEKGGGDGDTPRSDLREMAIFQTIETDSSGFAHANFKLPDNITSWRLTSQALTKDLWAGKSIDFIPVTLPFFVDTTLNKTYLAGDDLTVRLRSFGAEALSSQTNYTVKSTTLPFREMKFQGSGDIFAHIGLLTTGVHEVTFSAQTGAYSDSLIRPVTVLDSYFTKYASQYYSGVNGLKLTNDKDALGYTDITFGIGTTGRIYNILRGLEYSWGQRIDQKASAFIATKMLNTYFKQNNEVPEFNANKYQSYSGGIQLLPYSSDDMGLSAIAAHLIDDDTLDRPALRAYLLNSLNDKKSDTSCVVLALYGLTAFKEPVLTKLNVMKDDATLSTEDKIYIALGLDALGAKEDAKSYYEKEIQPKIVRNNPQAYIGGLSKDNTVIMTALSAALAVSIGEPEYKAFAEYADQNWPKLTLSNFERLLYVKNALKNLDTSDVSFSYTVGSKTINKTLKNNEVLTLTLSPQDLEDFTLGAVTGDLTVVTSYERKSDPSTIVKDKNLELMRTYSVNGVSTSEFEDGDLVEVRLLPSFEDLALDGTYQIVDYLPSGLRPITEEANYPYRSYGGNFPYEVNDQKVTFLIPKGYMLPIKYYAKVINKGTFKAEPAILQSTQSVYSITTSNAALIKIK
jgi:hypothetical protein